MQSARCDSLRLPALAQHPGRASFIGKSDQQVWVVVRPALFPAKSAKRPANWHELADNYARLSDKGHFASVAIASAYQPFNSSDEDPVPLWRGHHLDVDYTGLE